MSIKNYEFWFVVGSQDLYGQEVLDTVAARGQEMCDVMNAQGILPCKLVFKTVGMDSKGITSVIKAANAEESCAGVVTWCHTFSPSKMWIHGFNLLQKPLCHFATQYNRNIPNEEIDMDFMNLNQAAHGDREHGFILSRMRMPQKIVAGYWQDAPIQKELGDWMRSAVGYAFSQKLIVLRFGDNMRDVAVTEGDKVEAEIKLGWQVDYWPVGHLVEVMGSVTEEEIAAKMEEYLSRYTLATDNIESVRYQALEEVAIKKILDREGAKAYINNFQDLYGMKQLPGLASQNLMADGYGFGAEGDWKLAAMTAIVKAMAEGMEDPAVSFIEDYTYDLTPGNEIALGAHMLEVCPTIAADKPKIEVHPLGIGEREDPARLVFEGKAGDGIVVTLVDMGGRLRMIVQDITCVKPHLDMPNLPVARVMWKAKPDLLTGLKCWLLAGGAHHSVLTTCVSAEMMLDWAEMMQIECVHITEKSTVEDLKKELLINDLVWKLK